MYIALFRSVQILRDLTMAMAWQQQASEKNLDTQFKAFTKDIFYILDSTFGSEILIMHGFNLDNALLETLKRLNFPPLDPKNKDSFRDRKI